MAMKPKRIARRKEACARLGCGKTKFDEDYEYHDPADPCVPGTEIPRLKPIHLGPRNVGFLDAEIDELIDALAALRDLGTPDRRVPGRSATLRRRRPERERRLSK
jgi:predicted DNA-binding transcriptional regulator AlpA